MVMWRGFLISVDNHSGDSSDVVKFSIKRDAHWFRMVIVGAKTIVGLPILLSNSRPRMVLPDPGGATMWTWPSFKYF